MTKQESFKQAIRNRMAKTGEKYGAARRALIDSIEDGPSNGERQPWHEDPETSDDAVREATGKGWNEWCNLIDGWPERKQGHTAMAERIGRDHIKNGWWAQTVIVGYERIRGLRTKYMRADGTFAGGASRTLAPSDITAEQRVAALRAQLLDPVRQNQILHARNQHPKPPVAGLAVEQRSRATSKAISWKVQPERGSVHFSLDPREDGRVRIAIRHEGLGSTDEVETWKKFWADWLATVDEAG